MIKAVLFDLDGTLIDTNNLILQSFKYAFNKQLKRDVSESEIIKLFGKPLTKSMEQYDPENTELLIAKFREFNEAMHDELAQGFKGVEEALKELKRTNIKLAIVTSKRLVMTQRSLKLIGIFDYMDAIITPEDTEQHKPEAEPALKACEILGIEPRDAIMVGDSIYDILCGKNAGCKTCAVEYSTFPMEELMEFKPDFVVSSISELLTIIYDANGIPDVDAV